MEFPKGELPSILCCMCGIQIYQNPTNMCITCLRSSVDITSDITKQLSIHSCRTCKRFLLPPWTECQLESKLLMAACLKKISGLNKLKLIDSAWVWTEPHSLRLKIKITVQKEVMNGAVLQQATVIEYVIRNRQCEQCQQSFAQGVWHAIVQVRQRVEHKRTFYYLEQLLLKHNAHSECINIMTFKDGMDFFFQQRQQAVRFISFLENYIPISKKHTRKLVSADHNNNVGNFKDSHFVEIVPLCKDDLVILPKLLAKTLSNINPMVLIKGVGSGIHIIDPLTNERQEISAEKYWKCGVKFNAVMHSRQLVKYIVLSIEPILLEARSSAKKRGNDGKNKLAECIVSRESDFGVNDTQFTCISHLGYILREGDVVLGYDLTKASWFNDEEYNSIVKKPDLILVRKYYGSDGSRRKWELRELDVDKREMLKPDEEVVAEKDYELFMQELEGDREMRGNVNLYKSGELKDAKKLNRDDKLPRDSKRSKKDADSNLEVAENLDEIDEEYDEEGVKLDELLDNLVVSDDPDEEFSPTII